MHVRSNLTTLHLTAGMLAALTACSSSAGGNITPSAPKTDASREVKGSQKIFISGSFPNSVYVLNSKGHIVSTLTQGLDVPQGLATDRSGNLYVANAGAGNVLLFKPPYDGTPTTIADERGATPEDVAIDDNGNLAVTNLATTSGNGDVAFYVPGAKHPTSIVSSANFQQPQSCAFDKHGNLYLDNLQTSAAWKSRRGPDRGTNVTIGEIIGGVHGTSITQLKTSSPIDTNGAGSVQVTITGKIAIDNYVTPGGQGGNIYTYNPPKNHDLGTPVILHLTASIQPSTFAFFPGSKRLITADYSLDAAQTYTYPGGALQETFDFPSNQLLQGVAVYPTEQF